MQNKKNTNQVKSLRWFFILAAFLLLQENVWAGKPDKASETVKKPMIQRSVKFKSGETINNQIDRPTLVKRRSLAIDSKKVLTRQLPKDKSVVPTNIQKVSQQSEKSQTLSDDKGKVNNDKQPLQIPTKTPEKAIDEKSNNTDQQSFRDLEKKQIQIITKEKNKKVCTASPGKAPEMVIIPAGTFMMGSIKSDSNASENEKPQHKVTITRPFAIGRCEVTFAEYALFTKATGRDLSDDENWGDQGHPVINVSWNDAQAYVRWLSQATGRRYRLPTEAEWEYAARASTKTQYYWVDGQDINDYAWYLENAESKTHSVGEKKANPFGLYDTAGNIIEWVQDCWHKNYNDAPDDGSAWEEANSGDCSVRVLRGGSWNYNQDNLRSATRGRYDPDYRYSDIGFRLAQDLN